MSRPPYQIREYPLQQGALEIAYIEEYFNDFPKRKDAGEIMQRLDGREYQILMAEAPLPDDPSTMVPVSYKVSHEIKHEETDPKLIEMLTEREREVLALVARGLSNAEIGERIHVSAATAKTHVGHLLSKLHARDRAQLVMVAYESGLVAPGTP